MAEPAVAKHLSISVDGGREVPVVKCSGRLVAGDTERFYNDLKQLMATHKRIVVDFAEVPHLDSSGLGTLARLYVHAKSVGSVVEIVNIGKSVRSLLGITHMLQVFQMVGESGIRMG
jgi:anti-anti-sigma factor